MTLCGTRPCLETHSPRRWLRQGLLITEAVRSGPEAVVPEAMEQLRRPGNEVRAAVRCEIRRMRTIRRGVTPAIAIGRPHRKARGSAAATPMMTRWRRAALTSSVSALRMPDAAWPAPHDQGPEAQATPPPQKPLLTAWASQLSCLSEQRTTLHGLPSCVDARRKRSNPAPTGSSCAARPRCRSGGAPQHNRRCNRACRSGPDIRYGYGTG